MYREKRVTRTTEVTINSQIGLTYVMILTLEECLVMFGILYNRTIFILRLRKI